jgi:hypothetical protein
MSSWRCQIAPSNTNNQNEEITFVRHDARMVDENISRIVVHENQTVCIKRLLLVNAASLYSYFVVVVSIDLSRGRRRDSPTHEQFQ